MEADTYRDVEGYGQIARSGTRAFNDNQRPHLSAKGCFGVILRAVERKGRPSFEIVLGSAATDGSRVVAIHHTDETVIADWRNLGTTLRLPLYILTADGTLELASATPQEPRHRRLGSQLSGRRPRFLARRRCGQPWLMATIHGSAAV